MIRYRDLSIPDLQRRQILNSLDKIMKSGMILNGAEISKLEEKIARYCGRQHAIAVSSGTSALYLALKALGIGKGDEVITTCMSVVPTANAILMTGAKPIFVDVNQDRNINQELIDKNITSNTKAIVPVHYTGRVCDMDPIMEYGIPVIEDASQAFGARYNNKVSGSFGELAVFSLNAMKVFGACGEAGIIVTDNEKMYNELICTRYNGLVDKVRSDYLSLNHRMNTLQAAVLLERLNYLNHDIYIRRMIAKRYDDTLKGIVDTPPSDNIHRDVYFTYNICSEYRDELMAFLNKKDIETQARDSLLLHQQISYHTNKQFPVGEKLSRTSLALPIHQHLNYEDIDHICHNIKEFYETR